MDPMYLAYSFYRRRKFEQCVALCTQLLEKNPYDQVKAITSQTLFGCQCQQHLASDMISLLFDSEFNDSCIVFISIS